MALEEAWNIGSRENVRLFAVKDKLKFFYRVQTLKSETSPGVIEQKFIMINEDLEPVALTAKYHWNLMGTRIDVEEKAVDPESVNLTADKIAMIVNRVVGGEI